MGNSRMRAQDPLPARCGDRISVRRRRRLRECAACAIPEKVRDDVLDEYVSIEAARDRYGVVLTGSLRRGVTSTIDWDADPTHCERSWPPSVEWI